MSKAKLDLGKFLSGGRAAQQAVDDAIAAHGRERGGAPKRFKDGMQIALVTKCERVRVGWIVTFACGCEFLDLVGSRPVGCAASHECRLNVVCAVCGALPGVACKHRQKR